MHDTSPPESVHALDIDGLRHPTITFWSAWIDGELAGIGALKTIDAERGELKSMRVDDRFRGSGVGRAILLHIIAAARERGMTSLWLETGSPEDFVPAQRLYESEGFIALRPVRRLRRRPVLGVHDPHALTRAQAGTTSAIANAGDALAATGEAEPVGRRRRQRDRRTAERGGQHRLGLGAPRREPRPVRLHLHGDVARRASPPRRGGRACAPRKTSACAPAYSG